jgi:hypothetical protein
MNWFYALLVIGVCCIAGAAFFAVLVWPLDKDDEKDESDPDSWGV